MPQRAIATISLNDMSKSINNNSTCTIHELQFLQCMAIAEIIGQDPVLQLEWVV